MLPEIGAVIRELAMEVKLQLGLKAARARVGVMCRIDAVVMHGGQILACTATEVTHLSNQTEEDRAV